MIEIQFHVSYYLYMFDVLHNFSITKDMTLEYLLVILVLFFLLHKRFGHEIYEIK